MRESHCSRETEGKESVFLIREIDSMQLRNAIDLHDEKNVFCLLECDMHRI